MDVSFARWMLYGVPASLLMVPIAWRLLLWLFPPELQRLPLSTRDVEHRLAALGGLKRNERATLLIFVAVIALWLMTPALQAWTNGQIAPPVEAVALAGGLSLFFPGIRVLNWKEAEREIEWGGVMLIVAGLSLGLAVFETGAARWLAWVLLGNITTIPVVAQAFVIVLAVAALHLLFSSNTVTASIIVPILVALANDLRLEPWTHRGTGGIHLVAGVHSRQRRTDDNHSVFLWLLFNEGSGACRHLHDRRGGRVRGARRCLSTVLPAGNAVDSAFDDDRAGARGADRA